MMNRNIVVVGGSAGAYRALEGLVTSLPATLEAALFVVLHVQPTDQNWLADRLARLTPLKVRAPVDEPISNGQLYVATPDKHLMLSSGRVYTTRGPRENLWRPAIDVLFRTAAVSHASRVIGVLLSGELDDGTSGLQAIKACGGLTVVQSPKTAAYPTMPDVALANTQIDHCVDAEELAPLIEQLVAQEAPPERHVPKELQLEARMAEAAPEISTADITAESPTALSCPECGGPLWQRGPDQQRFQCLVGHAYHLSSLANAHDDQLDRTLWAAIRLFEQRANIAQMMSDQTRGRGLIRRAEIHAMRAAESKRHAARMRELQAMQHDSLEEFNIFGTRSPENELTSKRER
jgi:two-component system, chemotaxis family, protein-glutamate methylesterase/glutaminase